MQLSGRYRCVTLYNMEELNYLFTCKTTHTIIFPKKTTTVIYLTSFKNLFKKDSKCDKIMTKHICQVTKIIFYHETWIRAINHKTVKSKIINRKKDFYILTDVSKIKQWKIMIIAPNTFCVIGLVDIIFKSV